jgi:cytochrome c biogenesis protein CcdA
LALPAVPANISSYVSDQKMDKVTLQNIIATIATAITIVATTASIAGAFRAGVLKRIRFGSIEIEALSEETRKIREALKESVPLSKETPFEIEQLANYYSQILTQSKISFWFSLIFASLGFVIIIVAAFLYTDGSGTATVAQFVAGIIMDTVAGLFFVQSRNAQKSMAEFFEKLRNDRLHMESRRLVDTVSSEKIKDALRIYLSLHYAGVLNAENIAKGIFENYFSEKCDSSITDRG